MKLDLSQRKQAFRDMLHRNDYELKEYVIRDGKKHPFAVICPGGGYSMVCSFVEGMPFAKRLNEMGYSAFVVYYRTKDRARFPGPQDDLARAVKEILHRAEEWNLDTRGYSVWGASAGGHLAASFGTESMGYRKYGLPKPAALVLTYPVITMSDLTHPGTRANLLGTAPLRGSHPHDQRRAAGYGGISAHLCLVRHRGQNRAAGKQPDAGFRTGGSRCSLSASGISGCGPWCWPGTGAVL